MMVVASEQVTDAAAMGREERLLGVQSAQDASLPLEPPTLVCAMSTSFTSSCSSGLPQLSADSGNSGDSVSQDVDVVLESSQEASQEGEEAGDGACAAAVSGTAQSVAAASLDSDTLMAECLTLQADEELQSQCLLLSDAQPVTASPLTSSSIASTASNGATTSSSSSSTSAATDGGLTRAMSLVEEVEVDEAELAAIERAFSSLTDPTKPPTTTTNPPPAATVTDIESLKMSDPALPLSFRPRSILAATDLSSQLWCEHQLHLSLLHGRRVSAAQQEAMDRGTARHDQLEREMHDVVEVQVRGREEEWGLRFLNGVVGLHELLLVGKTRELMVMGRLRRREGERAVWIMGVIDEVERVDNAVIQQRWQQEEEKEKQQRAKMEENREKRRKKEEEERAALYEAQRREEERTRKQSIRNHFAAFKWEKGAVIELDGAEEKAGSGVWKEGRAVKSEEEEELDALMRQYEELAAEVEKKRQEEQLAMEEKGRQEQAAKLAERAKQEKRNNRARVQLRQASSSFVLSDNKTRAKQTLPSVAQQRTTRMQLSVYKYMFDTLATRTPDAAVSTAYTAVPTDIRLPSCMWTAAELLADMQLDGSRTFTGVMLAHLLQSGFPAHTSLSSLIHLYQHTFSSISQPSSPFLSVHYEWQADSSPLGSSSFPFAPLDFAVDLDWQLAYWLGLRESEGVGEGVDEWKCKSCEYVVECDRTRWSGRAAKVKQAKEEDEWRERERRRKKAEREAEEAAAKRKREAEAEQRAHVKVELEAGDTLGDESKEEVSASAAVAVAEKVRRARKRRSLEEMTLTQEDELEKARKEKKLQDIILIDIDE